MFVGGAVEGQCSRYLIPYIKAPFDCVPRYTRHSAQDEVFMNSSLPFQSPSTSQRLYSRSLDIQ